jgi:hypothetical protein
MTVIGYLSKNLWALGELTEPKLTIVVKPPSDTQLTVEVVLTDSNAVVLTDALTVTIPAGTEVKTIELGDFIDAQFRARNLQSGFYFVRYRIVETDEYAYLPLLCTIGYISPPPVDDPDALQYFIIIDNVTGHYITLPRSVSYIPSDPRFLVMIYYKNGVYGRLVGVDLTGAKTFDTGYQQLAVLKLTLKFNSLDDMLHHLLTHAQGVTHTAMIRVIEAINEGRYDEALKLLRPFYSISWMGRVIDLEFGDTYVTVTLETYLGWFDFGKIISWTGWGCVVGLLVGAGVGVATALTGGATAPLMIVAAKSALAGCAIGAVAGASLAVATSTITSPAPEPTTPPEPPTPPPAPVPPPKPIPDYVEDVKVICSKAREDVEKYANEAISILNDWLARGLIPKEEYDRMIEVINGWKASMLAFISDVEEKSTRYIEEGYKVGWEEGWKQGYNDGYKKGYDDGYKKAVDERKWWMVGAGVGGLIVGMVLGRR